MSRYRNCDAWNLVARYNKDNSLLRSHLSPESITADNVSYDGDYASAPAYAYSKAHDEFASSPHIQEFCQRTRCEGTLEPQMTLLRQHNLQVSNDTPPYSPQFTSYSETLPPQLGHFSMPYQPDLEYKPISFEDECIDQEDATSGQSNAMPLAEQDYDDPVDKPYARLIYEALLQAPGHKMMLRDMYDWFIANTTKPQESGSNGWQNSIRHNLSMNQAFENEKTDIAGRGHTRKANSVWKLTNHAIQNGVQSTTRYRKTTGSSSKRPVTHHNNTATQRQKSGSRGGKAARRAAFWRRQEAGRSRRTDNQTDPSTGSNTGSPVQSPTQIQTQTYSDLDFNLTSHCEDHRPQTPANTIAYSNIYSLPSSHLYGGGNDPFFTKQDLLHQSSFDTNESALLQRYFNTASITRYEYGDDASTTAMGATFV